MEQTRSCCFCWLATAVWTLAPDDRFCSLCGQRLASVVPRGPVLGTASGTSVLILYMQERKPGELSGCLEFQLGSRAEHLAPTWKPGGEPDSFLDRWERPASDALVLHVKAVSPGPNVCGAIGRAQLEFALSADRFVFEVRLYALGRLSPRAWLSRRDGASEGIHWVLYRDAQNGVLLLRGELGEHIPVQIEHVDCRHEAVTISPPAETAAFVSETVTHWDVSRLRRDVEEDRAPFRVQLKGLPPVEIEPRIFWRLRPADAVPYPASLTVPLLGSAVDQEHPVLLTNVDYLDLHIRAIESSAGWIEPVFRTDRPLFLRAGESTRVTLRLRAGTLDAGGPHVGSVTFHFKNRGKQTYHVRVERVRIPHCLARPLLIDPGPPRIVVAYHDPDSGELTYLPACGTIGLAPAALGLPEGDYLRALYRGERKEALLGALVRAVRTQATDRGSIIAGDIWLVGRPWVPEALALPGVRRIDALNLCRRHLTRENGSPVSQRLQLLEAWAVWSVPPPAPGDVHPFPPQGRGVGSTLGVGVARCLLRQLRQCRGLNRGDEGQLAWIESGAGAVPDSALWLQHACECLLADCAWGPAHAWDALLATLVAHLPSARACNFDRARGIADFYGELNGHLRLLAQATGQRPCALFSPLFSKEVLARTVQSSDIVCNAPFSFHSPTWLEWASQEPSSTVDR